MFRCEIICARPCRTTPEYPFPLSYLRSSATFGPPRCSSRFSKLVDAAWNLDPGKRKTAKVIYDSITSHPEPQVDQQLACSTSISETLFSMLYEFRQWLVSHEPSDTSNLPDPFVQAVASSMNEILPSYSPDASAATLPTTRLLECSGQDILKLMILVTATGT